MTIKVSSCSGTASASRKRRRLVEDALIAQFAHIARENIGQPKVRIARLGPLTEPRAAVWRAMPPFENIAFAELLTGVQHDLRACKARFDEDQRQHILQLIAIARRSPSLVRPDTAEQP